MTVLAHIVPVITIDSSQYAHTCSRLFISVQDQLEGTGRPQVSSKDPSVTPLASTIAHRLNSWIVNCLPCLSCKGML